MRDTKKNANGSEQIRVIYPKFKNGEASIRDITIEQNFDYVEEFYQTYLEAENLKQLGTAANELQEQSPLPMNSMLEKEERQDAVERRQARQKMTAVNVPPTTPLSVVLAQEAAASQSSSRGRTRNCTVCKRPMRGHNLLLDCPRNQVMDLWHNDFMPYVESACNFFHINLYFFVFQKQCFWYSLV